MGVGGQEVRDWIFLEKEEVRTFRWEGGGEELESRTRLAGGCRVGQVG